MNDNMLETLDLGELRYKVKFTHEPRDIRERCGLRLADVARACGCATSTISHWETAKHLPSRRLAVRYIELLRDLERRSGGQ